MKQVALVTGANRGIGFETCRQLARMDISVILTSRDEDRGEVAAGSLVKEGLDVVHQRMDVTDPTQIDAAVNSVEGSFGKLDILINNAAVYLDDDMGILEVPMEMFHRTIDVNFFGPLQVCRGFVPLMTKNHYGRIINISSAYGSLAEMEGRIAAYKVSKAALNALTRILSHEVQGHNIKVNSVDPGWVRTDMGGPNATRSVVEAQDTIIWLATLPDDGPTGGFFRDHMPRPW